ncbi:uncharacterized protein LOC109861999 [Pseudomyrmex gracilis]|uniref:uncharacterized protein LOC109861999 n=1 Tax=Pseudomyrmex gracilis TaxID=219809 RepID=UPI000994DECA|nr:uncharacterized protein LOC109861999 [Pseudomyrmex gracilis]
MSGVETCLPPVVTALIYADDVVVYSSDQSIVETSQNLNQALDRVFRHLASLDLRISPSKSVATFYSLNSLRNTKWLVRKHNIQLLINQSPVKLEWSVKFLGVHIDYALKWKKHVMETRRKVLLRINILKAITGIKWGSHPSVLITAYKGLVWSVLEWGCQVMYPLGGREMLVLSRLQYPCIRIACGLMRSIPTNVFLDIACEQPLQFRHKFLVSKYVSRVSARRNHPVGRVLEEVSRDWTPICEDNQFGLFEVRKELAHLVDGVKKFSLPGNLSAPFDIQYHTCSVDTEMGFQLRSTDDPQNVLREFLSEKGITRVFFTDGSMSRNSSVDSTSSAGFAVVSDNPDLTHHERIGSRSGVYEAEARGVLCALEYVDEFGFSLAAVASDSLSVMRSLGSPDPKGLHSDTLYLIKKLDLKLRRSNVHVLFVWIPGHRGIGGNDRADKYAKLSLSLPEPVEKQEVSSLYPILKSKALQSSKEQLLVEAQHKGSRYFRFVQEPLGRPWFMRFKKNKYLPRQLVSLISRIRSHHMAVNEHLHDKCIVDSAACPCGHPIQDINHLFFYCPVNKIATDKLLLDLFHSGFSPPYSVVDIAFSNNIQAMFALLTFTNSTNISV